MNDMSNIAPPAVKKRSKAPIVLSIIAAFAGTGFYFYNQYETVHPSTNDAYVNAHVVRVAAQISGTLKTLYVNENQLVHKDDLMFEVDDEPYRIAVDEAEAQLALTSKDTESATAAVSSAQATVQEREAYFDDATRNEKRMVELLKQNVITKADYDTAQTKLKGAKASLDAARSLLQQTIDKRGELGKNNAQIRAALARVNKAKLNLSYAKVRAVTDGIISNISIRPGATIAPGEPLFALVENSHWWVDANYKETDLSNIKPGQIAHVEIDMYPHKKFKGIVESISPATGTAFSLMPPENATGNWVKVTQRVPVKINLVELDAAHPLRIGASSNVVIDATTQPQP